MVQVNQILHIPQSGEEVEKCLGHPHSREEINNIWESPLQGRDGQRLRHPHSRGEIDNVWVILMHCRFDTDRTCTKGKTVSHNFFLRLKIWAKHYGSIPNNVHNYPKYSLFIDCNLFWMNQTVSGSLDGGMNGSHQVSNSLSQISSIFKRNIAIRTRNRILNCFFKIPYT